MNRLIVALAILAIPFALVAAPAPTHENVAYGEHERMKLDLWLPKSKTQTPLVIWIHGGGFKAGDKSSVRRGKSIDTCLDQDIAVASFNYPFVEGRDYRVCYDAATEALNFIYDKADEWNIDSKRVATSGSSAGCLMAQHLLMSDKRVTASGTYMQPMGTNFVITPRLKRGGQPMFLFHGSPDSDQVHHPSMAKMVKTKCDALKIPCELYGGPANDITPKIEARGATPDAAWNKMLTFFDGVWAKGGTSARGVAARGDGYRTWTDKKGRSIDARKHSATSDAVTLITRDGKKVTVKIAQLSEADQAELR
jgi:predicted esterase